MNKTLLVFFMLFSLVASAQTESELILQAKEKEKKKQYADAIKLYTKAIKLNPGNATYYFYRAEVICITY